MTIYNQLSVLSFHLVGTLMMVIALCFLEFNKDFVIIFFIIWLIYTIPTIYLHFEYWLKNKGEEYEIRDTELIRRKGRKETIYKNDEIEKIIVYLSPALYKNSNFHFLAIERYHYAIVKLKTGEELILTCLLAPRIDKALKQMRGVLFEKKKRLFCTFSKW